MRALRCDRLTFHALPPILVLTNQRQALSQPAPAPHLPRSSWEHLRAQPNFRALVAGTRESEWVRLKLWKKEDKKKADRARR